jgi:hypothetical protein
MWRRMGATLHYQYLINHDTQDFMIQIPPTPPFTKWGIIFAVSGESTSLWQREARRDLKV